jgi:hypothetical protein
MKLSQLKQNLITEVKRLIKEQAVPISRAELIDKISMISRNFGSYLDKNQYTEKCNPEIILNPANNLFSIKIKIWKIR